MFICRNNNKLAFIQIPMAQIKGVMELVLTFDSITNYYFRLFYGSVNIVFGYLGSFKSAKNIGCAVIKNVVYRAILKKE